MSLITGKAGPPPDRDGLPCAARLAALVLFCLWLLAAPAWGEAVGGGEDERDLVRQSSWAYEVAKRTQGLQTELPEIVFQKPPRRWPVWFGLPAGVMRFLLIAAAATIVVIILLHLRDHFRRRLPGPGQAPEVHGSDGSQEAAARMNQARDSADELARAGDYIQAMHLLLLQSVSELRRRLQLSIASCLTSREILARTRLGPEAKKAFADIIGRVEISYFGSHLPGVEDYLACRGSFEKLKANLKPEKGALSPAPAEPAGPGYGKALPPPGEAGA